MCQTFDRWVNPTQIIPTSKFVQCKQIRLRIFLDCLLFVQFAKSHEFCPYSNRREYFLGLENLADRFFSRLRTIIKIDSLLQTLPWRLATTCSAALQLKTSVIVRVNLCFTDILDCCVFEIYRFFDKL